MNLYQLSDSLRQFVNSQMGTFENNSAEINKAFQDWKIKNLLTKRNKNRYPKKYELALNIVYFSLIKQLEKDLIIFGYWFDGEFYTTSNKSEYKNTRLLHDLKLPQSVWDSMIRGLYYKESLKPYFIE